MKAYRIAALAVAASLMSALAYAQAKPEQQIEYRQSAMTVTARSVGVLSAMAKGDIPFNKDVAQQHAALIASISDLPLTAGAFGPGTDKGAPTKADPKVWSEADKFKAGYDKFIQAARAMPAAAVDQKSLQAALGNLGKTCKGCHDDYRQK